MQKELKLGVVGMPVTHSLSPQIHQAFAKQFGHLISYQKFPVDNNKLASFIQQFFQQGGQGLNITLPYKSQVIKLLDEISAEAKACQSVNTIYRSKSGHLAGDTTDGKGLLLDLKRKFGDLKEQSVLVIGAGGAASSVIASLLKANAKVSVYNRSEINAQKIIQQFKHLGAIQLADLSQNYSLIISSVSEFNESFFTPTLPAIKTAKMVYDLNYGERSLALKDFLKKERWLNNSSHQFSDGLGMLIGQAAFAYRQWTGEMPDISQLNSDLLT